MAERATTETERRSALSQLTSRALASFGGGLQLRGDASPAGFGRYRILRLLEWAPERAVFVAHDPLLDRSVNLELLASPDAEQRLAFARKLASLTEPAVASIYETDEIDGLPCLIRERVEGPSLSSWAATRRWPERLDAYLQVGRGLAAVHAAGIAPIGFSSERVVVGADGRVCIVDFALVPGDAHTDQLAFCTSLATALVGPDRAVSFDATIPTSVITALERGRTTEPSRRFPSMVELLEALGPDRPIGWRERVGSALSNARQLVEGGVAVVLTAVFAFVLGTRAGVPEPSEPTVAERAIAALSSEQDPEFARATELVLDADVAEDPARLAARFVEFADDHTHDPARAELVWRTGYAVAEMLSSLGRWHLAHDEPEQAAILLEASDVVFERLLAELDAPEHGRHAAMALLGRALLLRSLARIRADPELDAWARAAENSSAARWFTASPLAIDPYVLTSVFPPLVCEPPERTHPSREF